MLRQRKSFIESSYRNMVLYVATLKEYNSCHDRKMMSRQGMIANELTKSQQRNSMLQHDTR